MKLPRALVDLLKPLATAAWKLPWSWQDAAKARSGDGYAASRAAERHYERQLKSVAGQVRKIILTTDDPEALQQKLREYADVLDPWAKQSVKTMLAGVERKNVQAWSSAAKRMGHDMRALLNSPGVGAALKAKISENVDLIRSLPLDAAEKVKEITAEALVTGSRADDLTKQILKAADMTEGRARTIARTEVSKAQTALTQARAESVNSPGYIWRTARDGDTRPSHRAMEGEFVPWDKQPTIDGMTGHAGEFPNCRCYAEPVIPKADGGVYGPALATKAMERNSGEQQLVSKWEQENSSQIIRHAPGAPLVNVDRARFDADKLLKYALNPEHSRGRHKAAVFRSAIGAGAGDAKMIEQQIMAFLPYAEGLPQKADKYGARFSVTVPVTGPNGKTVDVLTSWIYDFKEGRSVATTPRLLSIYIPEGSDAY